MSETAEIRLVRCPKCENLLPEVTDFSIYQCGGCGAVLRANNKCVDFSANNKCVDLDTFPEKSDEKRVELPDKYEKKLNISDKRMMDLSDVSESDEIPTISSSSQAERGVVFHDRGDSHRNGLMNKEEKWGVPADIVIQGKKSDELQRAKLAQDFHNLTLYNENVNGLQMSNRVLDGRNGERSEMEGFWRAQRMNAEGMRDTNSIFSEEGTSNYLSRSSYDYENQVRSPNDMDGFNNVVCVGEDQSEILKKLDELKDQLSQSRNLNDKGKEKAFLDPRMAHQGPYSSSENWSSYDHENQLKDRKHMDEFNSVDSVGEDRYEILRKLDELKGQLSRSAHLNDKVKEKVFLDWRMASKNPYTGSGNRYPENSSGVYPDSHFNRPLYQNQYAEPSLLMHRQERDGQSYFPPRHTSSRVQGYGDPFRSQMVRRGPFHIPAPYQQPPSYQYVSGPYRDDGLVYMDPVEPYHPNANRHHPSCSCFQCCNIRKVPFPIQPTAFNDKFSDVPIDTVFNYHENPRSFGPRDYDSRITTPLRSHEPPLHMRWSSDVNSEADGFTGQRPPRVHLTSVGLRCRPIAGGAPFFTCYNCFELLLLPKKVPTKSNSLQKIKCGACSTVIVFVSSDKKLVVCVDVEATDTPVNVDDNIGTSPTHGESDVRNIDDNIGTSPTHGESDVRRHLNQARATFSSDDYDNTDYDFQSMDRELVQPSFGPGRANNSSEIKYQHSTSTFTTEAEEDKESVNVAGEDSKLADWVTKDKGLRPPAGSSLHEHFEYSNKFHAMKQLQEGNSTGRAGSGKVLPNKSTARQISISDSSATETDVSSNEFSNTGMSFDSGKSSRQGSRATESFFAGIIKKSFKELHRSNKNIELEKSSVTVNGHLISDPTIKKAENMAGPIRPGDYWYDYRAGFWGVMGGPCLGIIPPHIEEFNYPMPEDCADGNTDIFVNGRELNKKDLNLLKSRGLPTTRDRSYTIKISGRVIDDDTGEELKSLGKLAPSVERVQRGFGMRVPKKAAS